MKKTISNFYNAKKSKEKLSILTAYDYMTAKIVAESGVDAILVGDSLGMVVLGYDDTTRVTMEDMIHHTKAVARAVKNTFLITDMPFLSFGVGVNESVKNAGRLVSEGGCNAVKVEGAFHIDEIKAIIKTGIPVMGHLGYTPQSANIFGKNIVQGKDFETAQDIIKDAIKLRDVGVFSIVLECVPFKLAELITNILDIPTIGIGSGKYCDGQVLVINDLIALDGSFRPKHSNVYSEVGNLIKESAGKFVDDVKQISFPTEKNTFNISDDVIKEIKKKFGEINENNKNNL